MNIGENILKMRKEKGITQEQLADVLCISAGAVSKWETEASVPDISMLPKIADFFGVSIDKIFGFLLTENDTPENIIKRVKELTVEFEYDDSLVKHDDIKTIMKVDEAISILTDACIKFPNNYELKEMLCKNKNLDASKYVKEPEKHTKAKRDVLEELYTITKLNTDKKINDRCYNIISTIHLDLNEYDKALESAGKFGIENNLMVNYNRAVLTALNGQGKKEEMQKHSHNVVYSAISQIFITSMLNVQNVMPDFEKAKKIQIAMLGFLKIFSDDKPGPFDFYMYGSNQSLAFIYYILGEHDESVKCFEEVLNCAERFKIFSETKEVSSEFIKFADKDKFLYNMPWNYKQSLLVSFDAMKENDSNFAEFMEREDFQKFVEKLKEE